MFSRSLRAETRSRAKEDLKRVHKSHEQVRKWEKKWIAIKDTSMLVYRWVPSISVELAHVKKGLFNRSANFTNSTNGILPAYNQNSSDHSGCMDTLDSTDINKPTIEEINQKHSDTEETNGDINNINLPNSVDEVNPQQVHDRLLDDKSLTDEVNESAVLDEIKQSSEVVEENENYSLSEKETDKHNALLLS